MQVVLKMQIMGWQHVGAIFFLSWKKNSFWVVRMKKYWQVNCILKILSANNNTVCTSTNFYFYVTVCTQYSVVCSMSIEFEVGTYILGSSKSPPFWRKSQECEKPTSFLRTIQSINCSSLSLLFSNKSAATLITGMTIYDDILIGLTPGSTHLLMWEEAII